MRGSPLALVAATVGQLLAPVAADAQQAAGVARLVVVAPSSAAPHGLPAMYASREFVEEGGTFSYGPSVLDMSRRAAPYVDRILKGARPGDLPIAEPARYELVANLNTARILGLGIAPAFLVRADHVIE